jgi:xanthine dehydrogenase YagS FAD-binding subunit
MKSFEHIDTSDIETAVKALQAPDSKAIAGGTDLVTELKKDIKALKQLVNIKGISQLRQLADADGHLKIGALTTISELETDSTICERFPILSQAAGTVGTLQLRNAGTIGGNICQSVRCWYYRHPSVNCWLKGGETCFARQGNNRLHAIFGRSPCVAVNPSDIAPALIALNATANIVGANVTKPVLVESLFKLPEVNRRSENVLEAGELIETIDIPFGNGNSKGVYLKIMERATWSFAMVSAAVQIHWDGDTANEARIVLGGVAGIPWRVQAAEKLLAGQKIDEDLAAKASEAAVSEARPLEYNQYKIPMVKNLLKRAILELNPAGL